ncbi:hypothetical protein BH11GEM1_BH11GEM1_12730 [soil metagenome]
MRTTLASRSLRVALCAASISLLGACRATSPAQAAVALADPHGTPPAPPARWVGLVGEYGPDSAIRMVLERGGLLYLHVTSKPDVALVEVTPDRFTPLRNDDGRSNVVFARDESGRAEQMTVSDDTFTRRHIGPESGNQLVVRLIRPVDEVRRLALAATPPREAGPFRPADLVELTSLDPTIKLDIRYATSNNFMGAPFYTQARAFLQRPAALALVRVSAALRSKGYGLLVHDGYRPWSVTKMFWDATPTDKHTFVANPADGSKHNRGEAVDLSLYELATGAPVDMVSTYDETTDRAAADYPGGTSRQRWHRELLRRAMEAEHFNVIAAEWWHFDYADWRQYGIGNVPFEQIH